MVCKKRKYANGGKVISSEYGTPTFARAVMSNFGVGDGYGNAKSAPKPKKERMSVSNAPSKFSETLSKRKAALDQ